MVREGVEKISIFFYIIVFQYPMKTLKYFFTLPTPHSTPVIRLGGEKKLHSREVVLVLIYGSQCDTNYILIFGALENLQMGLILIPSYLPTHINIKYEKQSIKDNFS